MEAGTIHDVTLTARNPFGPWTWTQEAGDGHDNLATVGSEDMDLFYVEGDWISSNRVKTIESDVAPGETCTLAFKLRAPDEAGDYALGFHMVRDGATWYGGEVFRKDVQVIEAEPEEEAPEEPAKPIADAPSDAASDITDIISEDVDTLDEDDPGSSGGCGCAIAA